MMNSVEARNVKIVFERNKIKQRVLDGLNMTVKPGSIYSLIGASGCGKTTLLSCILGMKKLESGQISVLGHPVSYDKTLKVAHQIGYMPQTIALIGELTIREILYYFGNIFQMKEQVLKQRFEMVKELLELPFENRQIQHLSGGQQRRVSIAAAIIHNPLILILDEPTVGLDSLLRDKIWNFLSQATRSSNLSVIITTHYISEAEQADRCGLMRDGVLLAEDSPKNIMAKYEAKSLDEAFLNLCVTKKSVPDTKNNNSNLMSISHGNNEKIEVVNGTVETYETRKIFNTQILRALLKKDFIRLKRRILEVIVILIFPIMQILGFVYGFGGYPLGQKIGIVNNELLDFKSCSKFLRQSASYLDANETCVFNEKSSCYFLNEIQDNDIRKVFYNTYEEALKDAKKGKLSGIAVISENFTEVMMNPRYKDTFIVKEGIAIYLDQTEYQKTTFVEYKLLNAYENFNKKLNTGCDKSDRFGLVQLNFETMYGSLDNDFKQSMFAPFMIQALLFLPLGLTCYSIAQCRIDGVWNRTLLAGVKSAEILFVQITISIIVFTILFIEMAIMTILSFDVVVVGSLYLLILFAVLICLAGSMFGIALSATSEDLKFLSVLVFAWILICSSLSGLFWPLEGQPTLLRYISYSTPSSLASISVRNIMIKGYGLTHPTVYIGALILFTWIVASTIFTLFIMKKRKFV